MNPDTIYAIALVLAWKLYQIKPKKMSEKQDSAEILYWWLVITQIWVLLLIGWRKFLANQI